MSFDLYLRGDNLTLANVLEHFDRYPEFQRQELPESAYALVNASTGVYCYLRLDDDDTEGARGESLCFSLNYNRPTFFALETLPLVESLCKRFQLLVEDPQEEVVGPASFGELIKSWRVHNERAVKAIKAQGMALNYMHESKANEWWEYARVRDKLTTNLSDSAFVPEVFIIKRPSGEPFRMIVCPEGMRQILPPTDFVCIARSEPTEDAAQGLVSFELFLNLVAPYTSEYRIETQSYRLLDPVMHPEVISLIRGLELLPVSQHEQVRPDGFHDVAFRAS